MNLLTLDEIAKYLESRFFQDKQDFPDTFSSFIPEFASKDQAASVEVAIRELTDQATPQDFLQLLKKWDFSDLELASFTFGFKGTFAERLIENNKPNAAWPWWEGGFEARPPTHLFVAQSDPFVLLLDVSNNHVLSYVDSEGANTAQFVASGMDQCIRMLATIQLQKEQGLTRHLTLDDVRSALGQNCDESFWSEQLRHWTEFN